MQKDSTRWRIDVFVLNIDCEGFSFLHINHSDLHLLREESERRSVITGCISEINIAQGLSLPKFGPNYRYFFFLLSRKTGLSWISKNRYKKTAVICRFLDELASTRFKYGVMC